MPKSINKEKMVLISVHIPKKLLEELDELVMQGYLPSRSEAIRIAVRDLIMRTKNEAKPELMPGR